MRQFSKLYQELVFSSVWTNETLATKVVWITMLAMKSFKDHTVRASVPGLARVAGVTVEECQTALQRFMEPDPYSRSQEFEGRRIKPVEGGWLVLNGQRYANLENRDARVESWRAAKQRQRARESIQSLADSKTTNP